MPVLSEFETVLVADETQPFRLSRLDNDVLGIIGGCRPFSGDTNVCAHLWNKNAVYVNGRVACWGAT